VEAETDNEITHERAHQNQNGVVERYEDKHDAFWFLANLRPCTKVDGESDALWLRPFLNVVEEFLYLLKGDEVFEAKPR
jgi:hypothetical protein